MRAGVLMVAAMFFSAPAWAVGQGQAAGAPAHGGQGVAASHSHGRKSHAHAAESIQASGSHHVPKASKPSHAKGAGGSAVAQRHAPGEAHAAARPHDPASAAVPAPRSVTQKRTAPKPAAVRPAPRRRLVVQSSPPRVHRAIPAPHELPPILS